MSQYKKGNVLVVIIVVIAVAIVGLLGYIVWQNFFNKPADTKETAVSTEPVIQRPATKAYQGDGYTTAYLDTWTLSEKKNPDGPSITFTSPDYKAAMEVGAETGATVTINITPSTGDPVDYVKEFLPQVGKDPEAYGTIDVAGQTAYTFNYLAEGADFYHTILNYKGSNYLFVYQPAPDQADTYRDGITAVLDNFKFN